MASEFPKLPGYVVSHDPTLVNHKKVSHVKLGLVRNAQNTEAPLYRVPAPPVNLAPEHKNDASRSYSHNQYPNHFGEDIQEQFEPTFVKLDKQVSFAFMATGIPCSLCNRPSSPPSLQPSLCLKLTDGLRLTWWT